MPAVIKPQSGFAREVLEKPWTDNQFRPIETENRASEMTNIWQKLHDDRAQGKARTSSDRFSEPDRFAHFSIEADNFLYDFSKTSIDRSSLNLLLDLARSCDVEHRRKQMIGGGLVNTTERRAALHVALRANDDMSMKTAGVDVVPDVIATRQQMASFCNSVRSGEFTGATGKAFTDVVNIGIGGSDLGPAMAVAALRPYHDGPRIHFVSNIDGAHIADTLASLDPEQTLIVIASKTFTTIETMTNAETAIAWLKSAVRDGYSEHLVAVSSAKDKTSELGVPADRVFDFADWVGGRYSMWGPVGLAIMLAIGPTRFEDMLAGAAAADAHFANAPLGENLPVLMALVGIWHRNVCDYRSRAVVPYEHRLLRLPAYLQQLDMESNGKRVTASGEALDRASVPVVWGAPGSDGQHAFFQAIHQGTDVIPVEFLVGAQGHEPELRHQHSLLIANCVAQSEALMVGRDFDQALEIAHSRGFKGDAAKAQARHLEFPGDRPSTTLVYPKLTPFVLGQLIATFEHRTFVEGVIWSVNSFDQWGVELGKELAQELLPQVEKGKAPDKDGSTAGLIDFMARHRD